MATIKSRKELFALLQAVCEDNREYYSRFGRWVRPQIKVLWLEVNEHYVTSTLGLSGAVHIDKDLFSLYYDEEFYWIDTGNRRIWQIFTFAQTKTALKALKSIFLSKKGVDRMWALESFMFKVQDEFRYSNRGLGIRFKDTLTSEEPRSNFSAKLWIGRSPSESQQRLYDVANETFSKSSIRFGKNWSDDDKKMSGELYELFSEGHMTVNTCDDIENFIELISYIKNTYLKELEVMEKERKKRPSFIETAFSEKINKEDFRRIAFSGIGDMHLWLEPYEIHDDLIRYSGVDTHTGDFLTLDFGDDYAYISNQVNGCMNVAPRFGTLSAHHLSSGVKIFFEGVPLFV
ncbi:Uncharacterised protein [uncultured archaeon]|nr:Uncharacterised protein [uncultured archaeon]